MSTKLRLPSDNGKRPMIDFADLEMMRVMATWRAALRRRDGAPDDGDDVVRLVPRELRRAA